MVAWHLWLTTVSRFHIPGCYSKYPFFLHCGDDYGAEALRGHAGLDDVGVLLSFFCRRFTQINTDYFNHNGKSVNLFFNILNL